MAKSSYLVFWAASLLNSLDVGHKELLFPGTSSQVFKDSKACYDMAEMKMASFKWDLSILHNRLDKVSSFLDEVKSLGVM